MKSKFKIKFIIPAIVLVLLVGLFVFYKPVAVAYCRFRIFMLVNQKPEYDPVSGWSYYDGSWIKKLDKHRDKLTELGYLQKREFKLKTIKNPSLQFQRLWEELGQTFPDYPFVVGENFDSNEPAIIIVWDKPEDLPKWEKIILAHDAPAENIINISQITEVKYLLPFEGRWANEDGEVCYIISINDSKFKIETPQNEVWRTVLKNIQVGENKVIFDSYFYTDPNENLKSIVNPLGYHPFSGVRSEVALEINPNDTNELFETGTAVSKYVSYSDPNKYVLKKIK